MIRIELASAAVSHTALAAGWLAAGAIIFHRAAQITRRDGTLTRY